MVTVCAISCLKPAYILYYSPWSCMQHTPWYLKQLIRGVINWAMQNIIYKIVYNTTVKMHFTAIINGVLENDIESLFKRR